MTTKPTPADKKARDHRSDWRQAHYSDAALRMFEQATGQRFVQLPQPLPAVPVPPIADPA